GRLLSDEMGCGANLAGIGKAMALYSQDNDGDYPVAGGPGASWSTLGAVNGIGWLKGWSEEKTFGDPAVGDNKATITSCFYLLVRYQMALPKQFVCKGDEGTIFKLSLFNIRPESMFDTWDFGDVAQVWPGECCSYSYHMPFAIPDLREGREGELTTFMIRERSPENSPVCADRNPFLDEHLAGSEPAIDDNCYAHGGRGQNVLYKDMHVDFEESPLVGIGGDNIWCYWDGADEPPQFVGDDGPPAHRTDAYLVNEYQQGTL
ncbi:MAG: hypothetical protein ACYS8I_10485, partial [Planctomycetota bacterium]